MLEKPDLPDEKIVACLAVEFGLLVTQVTFLPLGADQDTAVYRVVAEGQRPYFLKLRRGGFGETSVTLPKYLSELGIAQIIPPIGARTGQLWAKLADYTVLVYPFIAGHNGYALTLTDQHWREFGRALRRIHTATLPPAMIRSLARETFSPRWRTLVKSLLAHADACFEDPIATQVAALLQVKRDEILTLVARTEELAEVVQTQSPPFIVCHSDLHVGNFLMAADGAFYIVDWDNPILAPKERDLMYAGAGLMGGGRTPQEEEALFYQGYGHTELNFAALAYYRYERIIQDIALFCEQLLLSTEGGADRAQSLHYLTSNFLPNGTLEIACNADRAVARR